MRRDKLLEQLNYHPVNQKDKTAPKPDDETVRKLQAQ